MELSMDLSMDRVARGRPAPANFLLWVWGLGDVD